MKTYKIWNKQDAINGAEPDYILDSVKALENDEIFLVIDEHGNITQIEIVRIIKSVCNLNANLTAEQTAQAYLDIRTQEDQQAVQDQITLEQLKTENAALKQELESTQQAVNELILNNITM